MSCWFDEHVAYNINYTAQHKYRNSCNLNFDKPNNLIFAGVELIGNFNSIFVLAAVITQSTVTTQKQAIAIQFIV